MNLFNFLNSKTGKFVLGLPQKVALTAALGGAAAGVMYLSGGDAQKDETPTRAYVMGTAGRNAGDDASGMGRENTINISGAQGIRSADGASAADGYDWAAGDASIAAVDRLGGGAGAAGRNPGVRGMAGRSEGLGGNNDIVAVNGKVVANGDALVAAGQAAGARAAAMAQRGVMATASGGESGNMCGGAASSAGGSSAGTVNRGGNSLGMGDGYKLSGSMPDGSSGMIASAKFRNGSSSFGDTRGARAGRGMHSGEGRTLEQIRKRSADIAKNKDRSANEGGRAFLAASQDSGGIQLDDGGQLTEGAVSDDFEAPTIAARKALDQKTDESWKSELQRKQHRQRLMRSLVTLIFLTIPAMFAINALMKGGIWSKIAAFALGAVMLAAIAVFIVDALKYKNRWGGSGFITASMIVGPLLAVMIGASYFKWVGKQLDKVATWLKGVFGADIVGSGGSAVATAAGAGQNLISETKSVKQDASSEEVADKNLDGNN